MRSPARALFIVEMRRLWTWTTILVLVILVLVVAAMSMLSPTPLARVLWWAYDAFLPIVCVFLSTGIVANDVKSGWMRTLLIRPITRQQYLGAKIAAVVCSIWIMLLFLGFVPAIVGSLIHRLPMGLDFVPAAGAHLLLLGKSVMLVSVLAFFSCWLPGITNIVVLFAWWLLYSMLDFYSMTKSVRWLELLKAYAFPSGFSNAIDALTQSGVMSWVDIAWGITGLTGFLALAFWSITKIQIDVDSE